MLDDVFVGEKGRKGGREGREGGREGREERREGGKEGREGGREGGRNPGLCVGRTDETSGGPSRRGKSETGVGGRNKRTLSLRNTS